MEWPSPVSCTGAKVRPAGTIEHTGITIYQRGKAMTDEEIERKLHIAGALGCAIGFICGAGLMTLVGIIF